MPHETAAVSAQVLCAPYNHAPSHFMQSHICKVHACFAVTCHLHFWQNDRDLLRATAVTRGWNGYQNKSQHRKSTLEKKILPPLLQGFEPATFQSRVRCSNHWAIPTPPKLQKLQLRKWGHTCQSWLLWVSNANPNFGVTGHQTWGSLTHGSPALCQRWDSKNLTSIISSSVS